jgi:FkbM family methyltransferase
LVVDASDNRAVSRKITKAAATFRVDDEHHRDFWNWYESAAWEPDTIAAFEQFLDDGARYMDLGAWIGPTALLAAATAGRVACVEPDSVARDELKRNLALNPDAAAKTTVFPFAVAATDGTATLSSPGEAGESLSSIVGHFEGETASRVETVAIARFLEDEPADFLKIDIEGAEYELVPAMEATIRDRRPTLYLSTHPNLILDKSSLGARVRSGLRALRLNRRMLRALLTYRHHYVYDERTGGLKDVRLRNVLRVLAPLPMRPAFLIGACVFTDRHAAPGRRGTPRPGA